MEGIPRRILTVSELTILVRDHLEQTFPDVWVEGEISNLRSPSSGHLYFTLKDTACQLRAVLFRAAAMRLRFALQEGMQVIVRGRLSVYEPRGEYQVILDYLEPKGIGALQMALEQLKEKLAREGLFDSARKRPLPFFPRRIGIVTSLAGAAIRDMLTIIHRRCPVLNVLIAPVPVQGDGAAAQIAAAIRDLGACGEVDVLIVGRGGGSIEDLWCFNDEEVVRAIAESPVPVVSAVGHEVDFTLADFAADYRAPTPSAAAEAVAPVLADLIRTLTHLAERQERAIRSRLRLVQHQLSSHCGALPVVMLRIQRRMQRVDEAATRLAHCMRETLSSWRQRIMQSQQAMSIHSPLMRIRGALVLAPQLLKRAEQRMRAMLASRRQTIGSLAAALHSLSPLAILARGYSIVQTVPEGRTVKSTKEVALGDDVRARLADGQLLCGVRDVISEP